VKPLPIIDAATLLPGDRFGLRPGMVAWLLPLAWAWAGWHQWRGRRRGRPLSAAESALARAVAVQQVERVRVRQLPRMPVPGAWLWERLLGRQRVPWHGVQAITLGHTILCLGAPPSPQLLAHELRHVQQCERAGSLRAFLRLYLEQVAQHGYLAAPMEVDARVAAAVVVERAAVAQSVVAGRPHCRT